MKRVYVVMGNDYPDAVFAAEVNAEAHCEQLREDDKKRGRRIHWRCYDFVVRDAE